MFQEKRYLTIGIKNEIPLEIQIILWLRQKEVLKMLLPYKDKIMTLKDERGIEGLHPLTPSLRSRWEIVKFDMPDLKEEPKEEATGKRGRKKAQKQPEHEKQDIDRKNESNNQNEKES